MASRAPAARRAAVEGEHRPEAEGGRADEPDLHRPEQVLEATPEERGGRRPAASPATGPAARRTRTKTSPATTRWSADEEDEVGHVRAEPERTEHQPVDDDRRTQPVLVERAEEAVDVERAALDDRPLVGEERQPLAEGEQERRRRRARPARTARWSWPRPGWPRIVLDVDAPPGRSRRRRYGPAEGALARARVAIARSYSPSHPAGRVPLVDEQPDHDDRQPDRRQRADDAERHRRSAAPTPISAVGGTAAMMFRVITAGQRRATSPGPVDRG